MQGNGHDGGTKLKQRIGLIILVMTSFFSGNQVLWARWQKIEEAPAAVSVSMVVTIEADGTWTEDIDEFTQINTPDGRDQNGTWRKSYNAGAAKFTLHKAEITNGSKVTKVPPSAIEDKSEVASDVGYDEIHNVRIAYPDVQVGSRLYNKTTLNTINVPVKGQYSSQVSFGCTSPVLEPSHVVYRSKLPLTTHIVDPDGYLDVSTSQEYGYQVTTIKLKRAVFFQVVNEGNQTYFEDQPCPKVFLSSVRDWREIGQKLSSEYEKELAKSYPPVFADLARKAKASHTGFFDRINDLTSALATAVRYHGNWRTVRGGFVARPLTEIATTQYGDCKDFSLITVAGLRAMGYKAHVAFVSRGDIPSYPQPLPSLVFNHAIVRVIDDAGKGWYIDPTNFSSRAQGIRPDIAGRLTLILAGQESRKDATPALLPQDNRELIEIQLDADPERKLTTSHYVYQAFGASAENLTGAELRFSKNQLDEMILRYAANEAEIISGQVEPYSLNSRIVKDLRLAASVQDKREIPRSTAGPGYPIFNVGSQFLKIDLSNRVSGLALGKPQRRESRTKLVNTKIIGDPVPPCSVDSRWFKASRSVEETESGIVILEREEVQTYGVTAKDLQSDAFKDLQKSVSNCLGSLMVVYEKTQGKPLAH